ncbi:cellobiose dehydrogenase protein [Apiospora arundinis]
MTGLTAVVSTVSIVLLGEVFAYGGMIPILPSMLRSAGAQTDQLQPLSSLVIAIHAATSMACFPAAGLITDRLRARRTALVVGLVVFSAATFWFFQASSVTGMLVAKGIQGGSSSLLWVAGLAWCFDVSDSEKKGTVIGLVMSANDVGSLLAPPIGGLIYAALGQSMLCTVSLLFLVLGLGCTLAVSERAEKQELGSPRWRQPVGAESDSSGTVGPSAASPSNHDQKPRIGGVYLGLYRSGRFTGRVGCFYST